MAHLENFDFGIPAVEEINIDEEAEAREYMIKMYERVRRLEKPTTDSIQKEIIEASSSGGSSSSITFSDDTLQEKMPHLISAKRIDKINVDGINIEVPTFAKVEELREWLRVLVHHEKRINDIMEKLKMLKINEALENKIKQYHDQNRKWTPGWTKDHGKLDSLRRTNLVSATESLLEKELGELGLKFRDVQAKVDTITDGLWIKPPKDDKIQSFINDLGTRRIVLTQIYRFNSMQTESLVKMMFSSRPDVRGYAKLDLMSKITHSIQKDLLHDAGQVLEIVCSEAYLTYINS